MTIEEEQTEFSKEIEQQIKNMKPHIVLGCNLAIEIAPDISKVYRAMFDALKKEGFTDEQAILITANIKTGGK